MTTGVNETFILGPEVGEKPEILTLVKSFEDNFNEKIRKIEKEKAVANAQQQGALSGETAVDHFVGSEVCQRCHMDETRSGRRPRTRRPGRRWWTTRWTGGPTA